MLIVNADDWGRLPAETDAIFRCFEKGRVTSVSAMVFMEDSERAAEIAKEHNLDTGLHLNFAEMFTANEYPQLVGECQRRIVRFLMRNKYSQLLYNPFLRKAFYYSYSAQAEEFTRLFGKAPSHVDGHHHMHLCGNMLFSGVIPAGTKIRRNFSFWPGEKTWLNRAYRAVVDQWLGRKYQLADYFFDLSQSIREKKLDRVLVLAKSNKVELMTHPILPVESEYLLGDEFQSLLRHLKVGGYALV